jgi:hypothetical protein
MQDDTSIDPISFNRQLDQHLLGTGVVDSELFRRLTEAYIYDAASTVDWVRAKLEVLQARLEQGQALDLFDPSQGKAVSVSSRHGFLRWINQHFPLARPRG